MVEIGNDLFPTPPRRLVVNRDSTLRTLGLQARSDRHLLDKRPTGTLPVESIVYDPSFVGNADLDQSPSASVHLEAQLQRLSPVVMNPSHDHSASSEARIPELPRVISLFNRVPDYEPPFERAPRLIRMAPLGCSNMNNEVDDVEYTSFVHVPTMNDVGSEQQRALIVDDSAYNLFVMREILSLIAPAIQVDTALNGQEALLIVEESRRRYDFIFLDIQMPVMDGY